MYYDKGDKVIIDDKKMIKEWQDGIKIEEDAEFKKDLQKDLAKFKRYMKKQKKEKKSFVIEDLMWESPESLCMYYLIGQWYMREENILGLEEKCKKTKK
jgi:hypothetical protein